MRGGDGGNNVEASQRAGSGDGSAPHFYQVIAIGMRNFFDHAEHMQPLELPGHGRWRDAQVGKQIGAPPAVDRDLPNFSVRSKVCSLASKKFSPLTLGSEPMPG